MAENIYNNTTSIPSNDWIINAIQSYIDRHPSLGKGAVGRKFELMSQLNTNKIEEVERFHEKIDKKKSSIQEELRYLSRKVESGILELKQKLS